LDFQGLFDFLKEDFLKRKDFSVFSQKMIFVENYVKIDILEDKERSHSSRVILRP